MVFLNTDQNNGNSGVGRGAPAACGPRRPHHEPGGERQCNELTSRYNGAAGSQQVWRTEDLCRALELTNQLPKDAARRKTPQWEVFSGSPPTGVEERAAFQVRLKEN